MKPIRILLADDHNLVRAGLRALLQNAPDVRVVAEAADGREALEQVEQAQPGRRRLAAPTPSVANILA